MSVIVLNNPGKNAIRLPAPFSKGQKVKWVGKPRKGWMLAPGDNEIPEEYWDGIKGLPGIKRCLKHGKFAMKGRLDHPYGHNVHKREDAERLGLKEPYTSAAVVTKANNPPPKPQQQKPEAMEMCDLSALTPMQAGDMINSCDSVETIMKWGEAESRDDVNHMLFERYEMLTAPATQDDGSNPE